jgi:subtilisin-like proprotein convertase family protein
LYSVVIRAWYGVPLGLVMPEQPLARFNGENPNGTWRLEVRDTAPSQTGVLQNWTLAVTALNEAPGLIQTVALQSSPTSIPDGGAVLIDLFMPTAFAPLSALTLTTNLEHQRVSDLVINLISPGGISLTVASNQGGANSNVFSGTTSFDAADLGPVTDNAATYGVAAPRLAPQESFAELNGINYTVHWKLRVADTVAGMTGTLNSARLDAAGHTCPPDLSVTPAQTPFYTRLGTTQLLKPFVFDLGAAGHNVALTTNVTGGFAFESATGAGWSCPGPAAGTLNPNVTCSRASAAPHTTATETLMLTAPLAPVAAPYTLSVSSDKPDLIPIDNTYPQLLTAFASSANGNPWDVADARTIAWSTKRFAPPDSGSVSDGGQNAFSGWGQLRLRVVTFFGALQGEGDITNLGLTYQPGGRWRTTTPQTVAGIAVSRSLFAPPDADWMRFADTFTNNTGGLLGVLVGWGGKLVPTSPIVTSASSTGDQTLDHTDTWAVTIAQVGPGQKALYPPLGYALHSPSDISYEGPYISTLTPITTTVWPSAGNSELNHVYGFLLPAHASGTLAYFVVRGLA